MDTPQAALLTDIDAVTLYKIMQLRTDVFVVEQQCAYPELDGRDLEPDARQLWIERDDVVVATLRLLFDADGPARIGRVATATAARGSGYAAKLMKLAVDLATDLDANGREVVLEAQSYLVDWYARFGFVVDGAEYLEDGIAHVPMHRERRLRSEQSSTVRDEGADRREAGPERSEWSGRVSMSDALDPLELGMQPHPEGGWYCETWQHEQTIETPRGVRPLATAVAFLLQPGERSAWHRVTSDELWLWQGGGAVRLTMGGTGPSPKPGESLELGIGGQHLVPRDVWQTAEPAGDEAVLVACIVSPGFDFADFTLAGE